jgi:glucosyl-3-phosphoglycerate synthase
MADSFQSGVVTTLHKILDRPIEEIESELSEFSLKRPMGLILPSLYSELSRPALTTIVDELEKVPYLTEIVIGLDQATEKDFSHALDFFLPTASAAQNFMERWSELTSD